LALKPDGTYEGIEVKSGTAVMSKGQEAFDGQVDGATIASAMLNGKRVEITSTLLINVEAGAGAPR
jgi:hypothetical protein